MLDTTPLSHAVISHKCRAVYFPIPKAACSSIKSLLREAEGLPPVDLIDLHDRERNGLTFPHMVDTHELHRLIHTPHGHRRHYFCFTLSRNPFTRLASAYLDKVAGKEDDGGDQGQSVERLRWTLYRNTGQLRQVLSFEDFVDAIALTRVRDLNRHWQHQVELACTSFVRHDWKIQIEKLPEARRRLAKQLGLPRDTPIAVFNRTDANARLTELYTPALVDKVRAIYARDFAAFRYADDFSASLAS